MKKLEREDWFTTGLNILNSDGFLKITIDNLCYALKVTKGSFYHHFKNMDGYTDALMKYWMDKNTKELIRKVDIVESAQDKTNELYQLVLKRSHRNEHVIRGWGFSNETVRKYVEEVDEIRIDYTAKLKVMCGENANKARQLAVLEYACLIGMQQLYPDMPASQQIELYELFAKK